MSNPIIIDLPLPPDCLHPNARPHWRAKAKATEAARSQAYYLARPLRPAVPFPRACYRVTFRLPRKRDYDGLHAWLKAQIDGLGDAEIFENDSEFRPVGIVRLSGKAATGGKFGVTFEIWPETEN